MLRYPDPAEVVMKSFSISGKYDLVARGTFTTGEIMASSGRDTIKLS